MNAEGDVNRGEDDRGNDQGNEKDFRIDLFHARGPVLGFVIGFVKIGLQSLFPWGKIR